MNATLTEPLKPPKQRERVDNLGFRIPMANRVLDCFAPGTLIIRPDRHFVVTWRAPDGTDVYRRWSTSGGQSFYPPWSHLYPGGGTSLTALSQLVRWCQGRPVLPMATWRHWVGEGCKLARDRGDELLAALTHAQYPQTAKCVLCGRELTKRLDWWHLGEISGPCCDMEEGCLQRRTVGRPGR